MSDVLEPFAAEDETQTTLEPCQRCGASLVVDAEVNGHRALSCEQCDFEAYEPIIAEWQTLYPIRLLVERFVWPYKRVVALVLAIVGVLSFLLIHEGGGLLVLVALVVLGHDPTEFCETCGQSVKSHDAYCWNCGGHTDTTTRAVPDVEPVSQLAINKRVADWCSFLTYHGNGSFEIRSTDSAGLVPWLVAGRERWWRRVLDLGIALGLSVYAVTIVYGGNLLIGLWTTPGLISRYQLPFEGGSITLQAPTIPDGLPWMVAAFIVASFVIVLVHELGHGIALYANQHGVDEYAAFTWFGIIVNSGRTRPDYRDGNRSLRAAWQIDTAGALANLVTGGPAIAVVALEYYGLAPPGIVPAAPLWWFVLAFAGLSAIGIFNLVPVLPGSDGANFQGRFLMWCFDRAGYETPDHGMVASQVLAYLAFAAVILGVVL